MKESRVASGLVSRLSPPTHSKMKLTENDPEKDELTGEHKLPVESQVPCKNGTEDSNAMSVEIAAEADLDADVEAQNSTSIETLVERNCDLESQLTGARLDPAALSKLGPDPRTDRASALI